MSQKNKPDKIDRVLKTFGELKTAYDAVGGVRKTLQRIDILERMLRSPGVGTIYTVTLDAVETLASANPIAEAVFSFYGGHLEVLQTALSSFQKYEPFKESVRSFADHLKKLQSLKSKFIKSYHYNPNLLGIGPISYALINHEAFQNTDARLLGKHLQAMNDNAVAITNSFDSFLWYYVRIKKGTKNLESAVKNMPKQENIFDAVFSPAIKKDFDLNVMFKIKGLNYGSGIDGLIKSRNQWAKFASLNAYDLNDYLNIHREQIGSLPSKKVNYK